MRQEAHLQTFDLILKTRSPIFIGCGKSITKKEYIFDSSKNEVRFLDEEKFFTYLAEHDLADAYEGYIMEKNGRDMRDFLQNVCRISESELESITRVRISGADAADARHSLKAIHRFVRDGWGNVYIPGSSIKGALRIALLKAMILKDQKPNAESAQYLRELEKAVDSADRKMDTHPPFDEMYFHTLKLKRAQDGIVKHSDSINSILQGIRVSDSEPIPDKNMCLTTKVDESVNGSWHKINLFRESIKPGVEIRCTLTLDQSILRDRITPKDIEQAIAVFSGHYEDTVLRRYKKTNNVMNSKTILLGGGVGFQSKTILGVAYPKEALTLTAKILNKSFYKHDHLIRDREDGISPRALKQTIYNGAFYPYGVCEVTLK